MLDACCWLPFLVLESVLILLLLRQHWCTRPHNSAASPTALVHQHALPLKSAFNSAASPTALMQCCRRSSRINNSAASPTALMHQHARPLKSAQFRRSSGAGCLPTSTPLPRWHSAARSCSCSPILLGLQALRGPKVNGRNATDARRGKDRGWGGGNGYAC